MNSCRHGVVSREPQASAIADFLTSVVVAASALVMESEADLCKTTLWFEAVERAMVDGFRVMAARPVAAESVLAYASLADMLSVVESATLRKCLGRKGLGLNFFGQLQRRQRSKDASAVSLHDALHASEQLGTPLWVDRARAELGRVGVGVRRTVALSPSERQVAELAASGMTNRKIAAAMFISPKTVESNLAPIYGKLGIHSRAELGRHVGQRNA